MEISGLESVTDRIFLGSKSPDSSTSAFYVERQCINFVYAIVYCVFAEYLAKQWGMVKKTKKSDGLDSGVDFHFYGTPQ